MLEEIVMCALCGFILKSQEYYLQIDMVLIVWCWLH